MENNNQISKVESLKAMMYTDSVQAQFKNALGDNTGSFVASLIDLFGSDSYLQACAPGEIIKEALKGALLKLPINKNLGFAYVIPYKGKPQFQIGYKGLIQMALRTGKYKILNADEVYEGELYTKNKLTGEFDFSGKAKSETIVGFFAHMELDNGFCKTLYMSKEKVEAHAKKYSPGFAQPYGPWQKEFNAMAKKTVLKNLLTHWGMLSIETLTAIEDDETTEEVNTKIAEGANKTEMDFDEAEMVNDNTGGPDF